MKFVDLIKSKDIFSGIMGHIDINADYILNSHLHIAICQNLSSTWHVICIHKHGNESNGLVRRFIYCRSKKRFTNAQGYYLQN